MNLREEILKEHSRLQTHRIMKWVGSDLKRFECLLKLFLNGEYRVNQRAGWPLSNIVIQYPHLIKRHLKILLKNLDTPGLHPAVIRNTFRLLQFVEIPKSLQGAAAETCFRFFNDKKQPVAVHVFSMSVLGNLCRHYPELSRELELTIAEQLPYASAGFRARAGKVLAQIKTKGAKHV